MWPRWEVFKKDNQKKPYQAVGSVHATDPEHALLNARNVFVRRPAAVSLWVVPASVIFAKTAEEIASASAEELASASAEEITSASAEELEAPPLQVSEDGDLRSFVVFRKANHRRSMTYMDHVGEISAADPESALAKAIDQFDDKSGLCWWIVPADAIIATDDDVVDAWFAPAKTKTYKQQSQYGFVSKLREGRKGAVAGE